MYFAPLHVPLLTIGDAEFPGISAEKEAQIMSAFDGGAGPANIVANFGVSSGAAEHFYNKWEARKEGSEEGWLASSWDSVSSVPGTLVNFGASPAGGAVLSTILNKTENAKVKSALQTISPHLQVGQKPPPKTGYSTTAKVGMGVGAVAVLGLLAWAATRK